MADYLPWANRQSLLLSPINYQHYLTAEAVTSNGPSTLKATVPQTDRQKRWAYTDWSCPGEHAELCFEASQSDNIFL